MITGMTDYAWFIAMAAAYLTGSIPFGLLIGRAHGVDIRQHGSKNIGATNCGRVVGAGWGLICFALDVLKGAAPVLAVGLWFGWARSGVAELTAGAVWMWMAVAVMPMLGHVFPVWLGFRGGKGVATGLGILLGFWPYLTLAGLAALATWLLVASCLRYVSLASVTAAVVLPGWFAVIASARGWDWATVWPLAAVCGVMAVLVIVRHRSNLVRLQAGTEGRLGR